MRVSNNEHAAEGACRRRRTRRLPLLAFCALTSGCMAKSMEGNEPQTALNSCGAANETKEIVASADAYRNHGLNKPAVLGTNRDLIAAGECYARALSLSPVHYEANLGLGVVLLARAEHEKAGSIERSTFLSAAKSRFGAAYVIRQGAFEPLYYLAEVAVMEGDYNRANRYLKPLYDAKYKVGPVAALYGYMAEVSNDKERARAFYARTTQVGWPSESVVWAADKLKKLR